MPTPPVCAVTQYLSDIGLDLPTPNAPLANYAGYSESAGHIYISGQGPVYQDQEICGHLGPEIDAGANSEIIGENSGAISIEEGVKAAQWAALNILAQLRLACDGDFDRVQHCVQLSGFVNATANFSQHPMIINGASDLIAGALAPRGRHSRIAVGVSSLPRNWAVEISAIFAIHA